MSRDKKQICLIHIKEGELHYLVINNSNYTDFEDYRISLESGYYDSALKVVGKGYKYTTYVRSQDLSLASPKEQLYKLDLSITDKKRVNGISFTPIDGSLDQIDHSTIKFADEYMCTVI